MKSGLRFIDPQISLQEVPGEITLIFQITGCPHQCVGCHSVELWSQNGYELSMLSFKAAIERYAGLITCVCFFGGEWASEELSAYLTEAKKLGYKTCLYSGAIDVESNLKTHLNYLKIGPWIESLGGLDKKTTNQKFINMETGEVMNYLFHK